MAPWSCGAGWRRGVGRLVALPLGGGLWIAMGVLGPCCWLPLDCHRGTFGSLVATGLRFALLVLVVLLLGLGPPPPTCCPGRCCPLLRSMPIRSAPPGCSPPGFVMTQKLGSALSVVSARPTAELERFYVAGSPEDQPATALAMIRLARA